MNPKLLLLAALSLLLSCVRDPSPGAYETPRFEQVSLDESEAGVLTIRCRMSSMRQLTEFGARIAEQPEENWKRIPGTPDGGESFTVRIGDIVPGRTYTYQLYMGNGRTETLSARNYYTAPE